MGLSVEGESGGEAACYKVGDKGKRDMEIDKGVSDSIGHRRHGMACLGATEVQNACYQPWCIFPARSRQASGYNRA